MMFPMIDIKSAFQFDLGSKTFDQSAFEFQWQVPKDLPYFEGHFPNQPLLPAIAIVDANLYLIEILLNTSVRMEKLDSAKFTGPILPEMNLKIRLSKQTEKQWLFEWKEVSDKPESKNLAQMTISFTLETAH